MRLLSISPSTRVAFVAVTCAAILLGCQPELRRTSVSSAAVSQERSEQMRLAREIRQQRESRLRRIAGKIMPEARKLCAEVLDKRATQCTYSIRLIEDDSINAAADGHSIYVPSGMVRFVESDDELAVVVGHEIAHNMLDHIQKRQTSMILGAIVDAAIATQAGVNTGGAFQKAGMLAYSQEYEAEADYLGMYLAQRAGFDVTAGPLFWRRMAIEHPGAIAQRFNATHPSTAERSVALQNTIAEIEQKRLNQVALVPERMEPHAVSPADSTPTEMFARRTESVPQGQSAFVSEEKRWKGYQAPPRPVGEWNYRAEGFAQEQGCEGENGRRPETLFLGKAGFKERFQAQCANGEPLVLTCWQGGCNVASDQPIATH